MPHSVYVVLLRDTVWNQQRFMQANLGYCFKEPCVYVGMTGLTPEQRLTQHLNGHKACWLVRCYGQRLLPDLYAHLNPMPYRTAVETERRLARELRDLGYAVWQN